MFDATPIREPLDEFLREVVRALHAAVNRGIQGLRSDPAETDKTLADCKELLDVVMAGHVSEWIATDEGPAKQAYR